MSRITYNPLCIRVGESIERCFSIQPRTDGGVMVANHHAGTAFMRDLDRDDALALYHWLGDHLMRFPDAARQDTPEPEPQEDS